MQHFLNAAFRMMGYPSEESVSEAVRRISMEQFRRLAELAAPWSGRREIRIAAADREWVRLESGKTLRSRRLARLLRRAESLEVCLVTLGPSIGLEVRRLASCGRAIQALALDAAASVAASMAMAQLRERACAEARDRNRGTTAFYAPGYSGWTIEDLPILFSFFDTASPPVRIDERCTMTPEKSLLGVVGIVPSSRKTPHVPPCRLCDLQRCALRLRPT